MDLRLLENVATGEFFFGREGVSDLRHAREKAAQVLSFTGLGGKV